VKTNARPERVGTGAVRNVPGRHVQGSAASRETTAGAALRPGQRLAVVDETGAVVRVLSAGPSAPPVEADPFAEVVSITAGRDTRFLHVLCPLDSCGRVHLHGLPWESHDSVTHRVAHCSGGGYRIVIPASAAKLVRPGGAGSGSHR